MRSVFSVLYYLLFGLLETRPQGSNKLDYMFVRCIQSRVSVGGTYSNVQLADMTRLGGVRHGRSVPPSKKSAFWVVCIGCHQQWQRQKFSLGGGATAQEVWGQKSLSGVHRSEAPAARLGPRSCRRLQTLFADFHCRNEQHLKISHNLPPDSRPACFTLAGGGEAKRPIWG